MKKAVKQMLGEKKYPNISETVSGLPQLPEFDSCGLHFHPFVSSEKEHCSWKECARTLYVGPGRPDAGALGELQEASLVDKPVDDTPVPTYGESLINQVKGHIRERAGRHFIPGQSYSALERRNWWRDE
ncbi:hypothetical protein FOZ62_014404, partial [Perkinsus olseni]